MNKKLVTVLFFFSTVFFASAQSFKVNWTAALKGGNTANVACTAVDKNKNVYSVGFFDGTTDFDPGAGTYNLTSIIYKTQSTEDIFISKLDSNGHFRWALPFGSNSYDMAKKIVFDDSMNCYIIGTYVSTIDFDPSAAVYNLYSWSKTTNAFILKLDSAGNFKWAKGFGASQLTSINDIALDKLGNLYVTGSFAGVGDFDPGATYDSLTSIYPFGNHQDAYISKFDLNGNFKWVKQLGSVYDDYGVSLSVESTNIYATGNLTDGNNILNTYICKLDSGKTMHWLKQIETCYFDTHPLITVDQLGNSYTAGVYYDTADFDPGANVFNLSVLVPNSTSCSNAYILKLDSAGNFIWAKDMGAKKNKMGFSTSSNTACQSIYLDKGNLMMSGAFSTWADFNPDTSSFILNAPTNASNGLFISKWDTSGKFILAKAALGVGYCSASSIYTANNNIYVGGNYLTKINLNVNGGYDTLTGLGFWGSGNGFVVKYSPCNSTYESKNMMACDSIIFMGSTIKSSGVYTFQMQNSAGCDSVITLTATINKSKITTLNKTICAGNYYSFNGQNLYLAGTYKDTLQTQHGCDSLIILKLNITSLPVLQISATQNPLCLGDTDTLMVTGATTYHWLPTSLGTNSTVFIMPTDTMKYYVQGTKNACNSYDSITINVINCNTGIDAMNSSGNKMLIVPNPCTACEIVMETDNYPSLQITDLLGKNVKAHFEKTAKGYSINMINQSAGIYFIRNLQTGQVLKFVKE
ncbi:MAG: hypothetical protein RJA07_1466 [Bacteroidota bacterium]|jgi:hypothetical protein